MNARSGGGAALRSFHARTRNSVTAPPATRHAPNHDRIDRSRADLQRDPIIAPDENREEQDGK
jgi:hypothetical protein